MNAEPTTHSQLTPDERAADQTTLLGFWLYLMTDLVLFASLFAVFAVLRTGEEHLFSAPVAITETLLLLASSFTCGLSIVFAGRGRRVATLSWLLLTFALGASFLAIELSEFAKLVSDGHGISSSGFLSSYFALVGTHGLHIALGLLWLLSLIVALTMSGFTRPNMRKLLLFALFWHFLDIVWICIFTIVYVLGMI